MVAPADFGLSIKVNGVEVSRFVPFESLRFVDYARRISEFDMVIENPTGVTPARRHTVVVTSTTDNFVVFSGTITELETRKRDNGITVEYDVRCADNKERLQKSIIQVDTLTGADTAILSGFLTNGYPDLSSDFDFSTDVTGFASGLSLPTGDKSILDALNDLADITDANWFLEPNAPRDGNVLTFDSTIDEIPSDVTSPYGEPTYATRPLNGTFTGSILTTGGNPTHCYAMQGEFLTTGGDFGTNTIGILLNITGTDSSETLENVIFDYYITGDTSNLIFGVEAVTGTTTGSATRDTWTGYTKGSWQTVNWATDINAGFFNQTAGFQNGHDVGLFFQRTTAPTGDGVVDIRIDNVQFVITGGIDGVTTDDGTPDLQWNDEPPNTDFNLDVDLSNEFGFDFDLFEGSFDEFNSITVVGGSSQESITWTYESDGDLDHFALETFVRDITVDKNTGSDASPTWTNQTVGIWGEDDFISNGGTADVLHDETNEWLYFDTNPSNLSKSIRVQGTISKPIRVRVEDFDAGENVYAKTITDETITSVADAVGVAQAELNKRKAPKRLTFKTYEPNLRAGQQITVTDSDRGLSETLLINRISARWISGAKALFEVESGNDVQDASITLADNSRTVAQSGVSSETTVTTASVYTDNSGTIMTDNNGALLYEVT